MSPLWVLYIWLVANVLYGARSQNSTPCLNPTSRTIELHLISHKDQSGRWVAEVNMEHEADDRESSLWQVDVKHSIVGYPGCPRVKVTAKITAPPPKPGPGYELYRGVGYYKLHTDKKTWHEAKATCESEGTHLAILNSEAESDILMKMMIRLPRNATNSVFLGFHDMHTEGQYLTIYDEPLSTTGFTRWYKAGQPDNAGASETNPGEDCGCIHRSNGGLNDHPCLSKIVFFCEQEIA